MELCLVCNSLHAFSFLPCSNIPGAAVGYSGFQAVSSNAADGRVCVREGSQRRKEKSSGFLSGSESRDLGIRNPCRIRYSRVANRAIIDVRFEPLHWTGRMSFYGINLKHR